jgi:molecular chaperone Hsp33
VLEHYMLQSEQLDTRLVLAANDEVAAGLLIQRLPARARQPGGRAGSRQRGPDRPQRGLQPHRHAGGHAQRDELLTLDADTLEVLRRLFWEETLRASSRRSAARALPAPARRERVAACCEVGWPGPRRGAASIAERGEVEVGCDFCAPAVPLRCVQWTTGPCG